MNRERMKSLLDDLEYNSVVLDFVAEAFWLPTEPDLGYSENALNGAGLILKEYKKKVSATHKAFYDSMREESEEA